MPADPQSPLEAYSGAGMAFALSKMVRSVTLQAPSIGNVVCQGVRAELQVKTDGVAYGGKKVKRAFTIMILRTAMATDVKDGWKVTDDMGHEYFVTDVAGDRLQQTLTCVGEWG
jgi:hypothetical protein